MNCFSRIRLRDRQPDPLTNDFLLSTHSGPQADSEKETPFEPNRPVIPLQLNCIVQPIAISREPQLLFGPREPRQCATGRDQDRNHEHGES